MICIWSRASGDLIAKIPGHFQVVNSVSWPASNPMIFASGSDDTTVKIWSVQHVNALIPKITDKKRSKARSAQYHAAVQQSEEIKEIEDEHERNVKDQRQRRKESNKLSSEEELNQDSSLEEKRMVDYGVDDELDDVEGIE